MNILELLAQPTQENWLVGYDCGTFLGLTEQYYQQFSQIPTPARILVADTQPWEFLAAFLAAVASKHQVFLGNSQWGEREWHQVLQLVQPTITVGYQLDNFLPQPSQDLPTGSIFLPTGGTSGQIRFAIHSWQTLAASVRGLQAYFQLDSINSFCVLPLCHVSGLMQFLRSFLTGGKFYLFPYPRLKAAPPENQSLDTYFLSLVPTQLQFLLDTFPNWLTQFQAIFLGGAPARLSLLERARKLALNLAPTYGMTETASQIATLKPQDFLRGNNSSGQVLPHAQIVIVDQAIQIASESLCLGYYPPQKFLSPDLGYFDSQGYLHILGRTSQVIISGGEKIFPQEVEATLLETELFTDLVIIGLPDAYWGQIVVAVYVPKLRELTPSAREKAITNKISKFKQPKYWLQLETIPRNAQGKVNYKQLFDLAQAHYENR